MICAAPIRYSAVSALCLLLHNAVIVATDALGATVAVAVLSSYVIVVVFGFLLHSSCTFKAGLSWHRFKRYALGMSANLPLVFILLSLIHDRMGIGIPLASPLVSGMMFLINYTLSRWALHIGPASETT